MTMWRPELVGSPRVDYYRAIVEALARDISAGILKLGDRLPPHRELATALGLSVGTVSKAYAEAKRRGYVHSTIGSGTFVRAHPLRERRRLMTDREDLDRVDLSFSGPVLLPDQVKAFRQALEQQSKSESIGKLLPYHRPWIGRDHHRSAAAKWLAGIGLATDPGDIAITSGAQNAACIVLLTIARAGDHVATEELTDPSTRLLISALGMTTFGLKIDSDGIIPKAFERACQTQKIRALVCMPDHHSPTLAVWPVERRRAIAEIARRFGVIIIENAVYRPFLETAAPALASFAPERSYYVTSFSKILTPGLRVGYLAAPPGTADELVLGLGSTIWMASPVMAEIVSDWIDTGVAERLARKQRRELAARNGIAREIFGTTSVTTLPSGLHVWLNLPDRWRSESLKQEIRESGILVSPGEDFATAAAPAPPAIRISLGGGASSRQVLAESLKTIKAVLDRKAGSLLDF